MTPDEIDREVEAEFQRMEESVMKAIQKEEDEAAERAERLVEDERKYKDVTGWPSV
jgi:hypothetical protein